MAKNIYWTDSGSDVIAVARTDGRFHRTLLFKSAHLHQPRGIALYPSKGWVHLNELNKTNLVTSALVCACLYTAKNATDLLQVVYFTGLMQVAKKLYQAC